MDTIELAIDAVTNAWDAFGDWLAANETQADLYTVWVLVIGFGILAAVKAVTWWTVRCQHDRTDVGRSLKRQKIAEAVMFACLTALYGASLIIYYSDGGVVLGVWQRMGIRLILVGGIIMASLAGIRFIRALRAESFGQPDREAAMDARDVEQGNRQDRQDARSDRQQRREDAWGDK